MLMESLVEPRFIKSLKSYCHLQVDSNNVQVHRVSRNVLGNTLYISEPLFKLHTLSLRIDQFSTNDIDRLKKAYCFSFGVSTEPPAELMKPLTSQQEDDSEQTATSVDHIQWSTEILIGGIYKPESVVKFKRSANGFIDIVHDDQIIRTLSSDNRPEFDFEAPKVFVQLDLHGTCTKLALLSIGIDLESEQETSSLEQSLTKNPLSIPYIIADDDKEFDEATFDTITDAELSESLSDVATETWLSTTNVEINDSVFTWIDQTQNGMVLSQAPLKRLAFRIREMDFDNHGQHHQSGFHELTFAIIDSNRFQVEHWPLLGQVTQLAKIAIDGITKGLEFAIQLKDGSHVDMCVDGQVQTLMKCPSKHQYLPLLLFSGSIRSLELISSELIPCFGIDKDVRNKHLFAKIFRPLSVTGEAALSIAGTAPPSRSVSVNDAALEDNSSLRRAFSN